MTYKETITIELEIYDVENIELYRKLLATKPCFYHEKDKPSIVMFGGGYYNFDIAMFLGTHTPEEIEELNTLSKISSLEEQLHILKGKLTDNK